MIPQRGHLDGACPVKAPERPDSITHPLVLNSADLFGSRNEIRVHHNGQEYRLRITKAGKLILTK
jgi:hemin uptake protein HemP